MNLLTSCRLKRTGVFPVVQGCGCLSKYGGKCMAEHAMAFKLDRILPGNTCGSQIE